MYLSVIIPVFNEELTIAATIEALTATVDLSEMEIIIVDGGSTDRTVAIVQQSPHCKLVQSQVKGRAAQMNLGASLANGIVLYFVHADVKVHPSYAAHIRHAILDGVDLGCYRYRFNSPKLMLRFNGYMTKFNSVWAGGGDQTLFLKKEVFNQLSGFQQEYIIMEDFDMVKRARKMGFVFKILPYSIIVSARKYDKNSWLRVQVANTIIVVAWKLGAGQQWMKNTYKKMLHH